MITAQNEAMTRLRMRMLSYDSGGGCFFKFATSFEEDSVADAELLGLNGSSSIGSTEA